jgi:hypothetical protein
MEKNFRVRMGFGFKSETDTAPCFPDKSRRCNIQRVFPEKEKILKLCASRTPQTIRIIAVAHTGGYLLE